MSDFNLEEIYSQLHTLIVDIDEKLDASGDSTAATTRKVTNELIEEAKDQWTPASTAIVSQFEAMSEDQKIGVYFGLIRALNSELGKPINELLKNKVEAMPKPEIVPLTDEEKTTLEETRKGLVVKIKSVIEMAKNFGVEADMEMPKRRTGKTGPRGKRALSFFTWSIEDKTYDKLRDVVEEYSEYSKVSELTKAMREVKIDTTNPGSKIEFTLPDGKVLVGVRDTSDDDDDDDDDSSDDDSTETTDED